MQYMTKDGDTLDRICWQYYDGQQTTVAQVLEANPGLADHGPLLPAGIIITLPALVTPAKEQGVSLWD
jgi:phage tail protein X